MKVKRLICLFKGHDWVLAPIPSQKSSPAYPTPDLVGKRLLHFCLRCGLTKMKIAGLSRKQMEWLEKSRLRDYERGNVDAICTNCLMRDDCFDKYPEVRCLAFKLLKRIAEDQGLSIVKDME